MRAQIAQARDKLARKCDSLARSVVRAEEIERLQVSGELILAYSSRIKKGQELLKAEGTRGTVDIVLDQKLSAIENAQKYFKELFFHHLPLNSGFCLSLNAL